MGEAKRRREAPIAANVPDLAEYIGDRRANGFKDFVARMLVAEDAALKCGSSPSEQMLLRLIRTQLVATMESLRIEEEKGGDVVVMASLLPRAMGVAAMNCLAGLLREDVPARDFAVTLTESFRFAAKQAAEQIDAANT